MDTTILFTLAEIAVALAGFSAIVGVLRSRKGAADIRSNAIRLQVMMETCFIVALTAIVPGLFGKFDLAIDVTWRFSSAVFLCLAIPFEFIAYKRVKGQPDLKLAFINANTINWALSIGADIIMILVLINVFSDLAEPLFLLALFLYLILSGNLFVQFAAETFSAHEAD